MPIDWRRALGLLAASAVFLITLSLIRVPVRQREASQPRDLPAARAAVSAPVAERTAPAEAVTRAVERVIRGVSPLPYVVDQSLAAELLDQWHGRLPEAKVLVAAADQFNAGAEEGHLVPLQLYLDTGERVFSLAGEAAFAPSPEGMRIRRLSLKQQPLLVDSWTSAARRLREATGVEPKVAGAPFYGLFRFTVGDRHYAINAATGALSQE